MPTIIHSNGSKWAGEKPDTIARLVKVLDTETLNPIFEGYGGFIQADRGTKEVRFFGNFQTVSHVFRITTDDPQDIARLTAAIHANVHSERYQAARRAFHPCPKCNKLAQFCRCKAKGQA